MVLNANGAGASKAMSGNALRGLALVTLSPRLLLVQQGAEKRRSLEDL